MGYLSYADDITIMRLSVGGLNEMLKICSSFAQSSSIIFNNKKTVCIKYGKEIVKNEKAVLNTHVLKLVDKVKHLGNYMNKYNNKFFISDNSQYIKIYKTHTINKLKIIRTNGNQ